MREEEGEEKEKRTDEEQGKERTREWKKNEAMKSKQQHLQLDVTIPWQLPQLCVRSVV